jgi:hypothetical protein
MKALSVLVWILRFIVLCVLFDVFFLGGAQLVSGLLPNIQSEPGLVSPGTGILIVTMANTLLVMALVLSSRWSGWKLALGLAFAYYGAVTFLMQIETWYFLSNITVGPQLLPRLFAMGIPVAFLFVPLAVWVLGKGRGKNYSISNPTIMMPLQQWVLKLGIIAMAYLVLYWSAGYFIAWQNPELRAFYGSPGAILPFWTHTLNTLHTEPGLLPFQIMRSMLWTLCALPVIRGSKINAWWTAILVGLFFSIPQNIGHILANPLLPIASVRFSHMIETSSSTFIFGLIVFWLLHRYHTSVSDLLGIERYRAKRNAIRRFRTFPLRNKF